LEVSHWEEGMVEEALKKIILRRVSKEKNVWIDHVWRQKDPLYGVSSW